jgi:hypothetical protein
MIGTILRAKWLPYVVIGSVIWTIAAYGYGHLQGYGAAEVEYTAVMNQALADQLKRERAQAATDLAAAVGASTRGATIRHGIKSVNRPIGDCNSADWLRAYNDGVGIVQAATAGPAGATGTTEASARH